MTRSRVFLALFVFGLCTFASGPAASGSADSTQDVAAYIRAHYTKYEFLVPMRDGVRLFTSVYTPKERDRPWPILLLRTPYSVAPYGPDNYRTQLGPPSEKFMRDGYIFVYQDVRGRVRSEGSYLNVRPIQTAKKGPGNVDDSSDTYDTVDWLVKNIPNNNGRAGMWGISYPGFYAALGAIDSHPALKAVSPQAPVINWFIGDDFRHNGALFLAHAFGFFSLFGQAPVQGQQGPRPYDMGTPDGYEFHLAMGPLANYDEKLFHGKIEFWKELLENDTFNDFWKSRDPRPYVKNLKPAMMTVGGWFDAEDVFGPLNLYKAAEKQNPGAYNILVEGPWSHGGWARSDGQSAGQHQLRFEHIQIFPGRDRISFFPVSSQGRWKCRQAARSLHFRNRPQ